MEIQRCGSQPSAQGPEAWFTGRVRVDLLFKPNETFPAIGAKVTFEPGTPTPWARP
jgi:quercetin dioxygenase-like cupin family protein